MTFRISMSRPGGAWLAAMTFLLMLQSRSSCAGASYTVTDLGVGNAVAINNSGTVVINDGNQARVVIGQTVATIPNITTAYSINDSGIVAGSTLAQAIVLQDTVNAIKLFQDSSQPQNGLRVVDSLAVNNSNRLTGSLTYEIQAGSTQYVRYPVPSGTGGSGSDGFNKRRFDINESGFSAGSYSVERFIFGVPPSFIQRRLRAALFGSDESVVLLDARDPGDLAGTPLSEAKALNDLNHAVGYMAAVPDGPVRAFWFDGSTVEDLGTLGGTTSRALGINNSDQIVGEAAATDGLNRAFFWESGMMIDLNSAIPAGSGWVLRSAKAINENGQIVGNGVFQGIERVFLLSPSGPTNPPTITAHPTGATVVAGASLTLSATATGDQPLTYQWQLGGTNLVGQTNTSLTLTNIQMAHRGEYRIVVNNSSGTAVSQIATVAIKNPVSGYTLTDLGQGDSPAINNSGKILVNNGGIAYLIDGSTRLSLTNIYDYEWGNPYRLAITVTATDISDDGRIAGISVHQGRRGSFYAIGDQFNPITTNTFFSQGSGEYRQDSVALNNNGGSVVLAYYQGGLGWSSSFPSFPGNYATTRRDINGSGISVGSIAQLGGGGIGNPAYERSRVACFFTANNEFILIDTRAIPGSPSHEPLSEAMAINALGHAVGIVRPSLGAPMTAFRYVVGGAGMESLGTLGGTTSQALGINDSEQIVGEASDGNGQQRAFVWENGTMTDLNSFLPSGSGWILTTAKAINNSGQIVGNGISGGVQRAFLLSPFGLGTAPTISTNPTAGLVVVGTNYTMFVSALGSQPLHYQWQRNEVDVPGQTNGSLTVTNVNGLNAGSYRVVVSNAAGTAISQPISLSVVDPLVRISVHAVAITITGEVGGNYRLDYLTQIQPPVWAPVTTLVLTNSPQTYVDYGVATNANRIFRAVRIP